MSKKCELTGKSLLKGHKVSHANNKTKRKFLPNLKKVTFMSNILKKKIKLKVTNSALRSVDKKGSIDTFLKDVKFVNLSPRVKKIKKLEKESLKNHLQHQRVLTKNLQRNLKIIL